MMGFSPIFTYFGGAKKGHPVLGGSTWGLTLSPHHCGAGILHGGDTEGLEMLDTDMERH